MHQRRWLPLSTILALLVFAANLCAVAIERDFSWRLGGFVLTAHSVYKPLQLLEAVVVLVLLLTPAGFLGGVRTEGRLPVSLLLTALSLAAALIYAPSLTVNFSHHDWTHRHISADLTSAAAVRRLFTVPQVDGMYRPLGFLSLWLDYRLFGQQLWGYHLQSILIHVLNTLLVFLVSRRLAQTSPVALTAAAVFGLGSAHAEAVVWPAARFDLLAALFVLLALYCFLRFLEMTEKSRAWAALSVGCFVVAVLNKETGYAFVLLVPALLLMQPFFGLQATAAKRVTALLCAVLAATAVLAGIRWGLFGGIGGYDYPAAQPLQSLLTIKSLYSLIANTLTLSLFSINTAPLHSIHLPIVAIVAAISLLLIGLFHATTRHRQLLCFVTLGLLSAVPVVHVMGWINPTLENSRHLYLPSVWTSLFIAAALEQARFRAVVIAVLVVAQAACLSYNIWAFRDAFSKTAMLAQQVKVSVTERLPQSTTPEITLTGVPEHWAGVFYFGPELKHQIELALPLATVKDGQCEANTVCYQWDPTVETLTPRP